MWTTKMVKTKAILLAMTVVLICALVPLPMASAAEVGASRWNVTELKPDAEARYSELVIELTAALVNFAVFDLTSLLEEGEPALDELAARRDEFRAALLEIKSMHPQSEFHYFHCNIIPLHEQILEAMDLIIDAAVENDKAKAFTGRILLLEVAQEISIRVGAQQVETPVPSPAATVTPTASPVAGNETACVPPPGVPMPSVPRLTIPFYSRADYEKGELEEPPEEAWYERQPPGGTETVKLVLEGEQRYWVDRIRLDARWLYFVMEEVERLVGLLESRRVLVAEYPALEGDLVPWMEGRIRNVVTLLDRRAEVLAESLAQAKVAGLHIRPSWDDLVNEAGHLADSARDLPTLDGIGQPVEKPWEELPDDVKLAIIKATLKERRESIELMERRLPVLRQILASYLKQSQGLSKAGEFFGQDINKEREGYLNWMVNNLGGAVFKYFATLAKIPEDVQIALMAAVEISEDIDNEDWEEAALKAADAALKIYSHDASKFLKTAQKVIGWGGLGVDVVYYLCSLRTHSEIMDSLDAQVVGFSQLVNKVSQENNDLVKKCEEAKAEIRELEQIESELEGRTIPGDVKGHDDWDEYVKELGGVDFTSIELRYVSLSSNRYVLKAELAEEGDGITDLAGVSEKIMAYFFTGLTLPNSNFWVNLVPWQPERIAGEDLGVTDVGRIMLEADLQMKRDFCKHLNPCESEVGEAYWDAVDRKQEQLVTECMNMYPGQIQAVDNVVFGFTRSSWIVPDQITAYGDGDEIYIADATLDIRSEPEYEHPYCEIVYQSVSSISENCIDCLAQAWKEFNRYSAEMEEELVLPLVVEEVNNGPQYSALRQVYVSLALAQWYKDHAIGQSDFADLIESENLTGLESESARTPTDIWSDYVKSLEEGEFHCETEKLLTYRRDGETFTEPAFCTFGGVGFDDISSHISIAGNIDLETTERLISAVYAPSVAGANEYYLGDILHPPSRPSEDGGLSPVHIALIALGVIAFWFVAWRARSVIRW